MIATFWIAGLVAAAASVSASTEELQFFSRLLKRQEPGTPAYNCHDNCGQAIIQARESADACNDEIFVTNYQNCLQCSGPDNENIWRYYGNTLSNTGEQCGLSTEPLSGTQPGVGPAVTAGSSVSSSSDEPTSSTTAATEPTSEPAPTVTEESSSLTSASATSPVTLAPTTTGGVNGTSSSTPTSETAVVTAAANALSVHGVAVYGVLAFGALCVAGQ